MTARARHRVDNVPWPLRPLFWLYSYGLGLSLFALRWAWRRLVRVRWENAATLGPGGHIFCAWHENVVAYFISPLLPEQQAWMNHPDWYMEPVYVMMRCLGIRRMFLGSTGHGGREAADQLAVALAQGASTMLFVDGPAGPAFELKRGALHLAAQTGLPLVPLRYRFSRSFRLCTWDRKRFPLPFSTLRVSCGEPLRVQADRLDEAERALLAALGRGEPD